MMNDKQLDMFLEALKAQHGSPDNAHVDSSWPPDRLQRRFHDAILHRRRMFRNTATCVCSALLLVCILMLALRKTSFRLPPTPKLERMAAAIRSLRQPDILFVNDELVVSSNPSLSPRETVIQMTLAHNLDDNSSPLELDFPISGDDYISIDTPMINGNIMVSRCNEAEYVMDINLRLEEVNGMENIQELFSFTLDGHVENVGASNLIRLEIHPLPIQDKDIG